MISAGGKPMLPEWLKKLFSLAGQQKEPAKVDREYFNRRKRAQMQRIRALELEVGISARIETGPKDGGNHST